MNLIENKTVYLSGPITNNPNYKLDFYKAHSLVAIRNPKMVFDPSLFPEGWDYDHYLEHDMIFIKRCDVIVLLPDHENSKGCFFEMAAGTTLGKKFVHLGDL